MDDYFYYDGHILKRGRDPEYGMQDAINQYERRKAKEGKSMLENAMSDLMRDEIRKIVNEEIVKMMPVIKASLRFMDDRDE